MKGLLISLLILITTAVHAAPEKDNNFFTVSTSGWDVTVRTTVPGQTYATAGIKITTPGVELTGIGSQCARSGSGYCTFSVSDTKPATISVIGAAGDFSFTLCLDGAKGQTCQVFTQRLKIAYITNYGAFAFKGSIAECAIKSNGLLDFCQNAGDGDPMNGPTAIVLNTAHTLSYLVNYNASSLLVCPLNSLGQLDACIQEYVFPSGFDYSGEALTPSGNALIVTNNDDNTVERCPILSNGKLGSCVDAGATVINSPYGILLNKAGTLAWVANRGFPGSVTVCNVANGFMSGCQDSGFAFTGLGPQDFGINKAETFLYVSNAATVQVCTLTANGTFSGCVDALPGGPFSSGVWGIRLNKANSKAYVTDFDNSVTYLCTIKTDGTGTFESCTDSGQLFTNPAGITLLE